MLISLDPLDLEELYYVLFCHTDNPDIYGVNKTFLKFQKNKYFVDKNEIKDYYLIELNDTDIDNILFALNTDIISEQKLYKMFYSLYNRLIYIKDTYLDSFKNMLKSESIPMTVRFNNQLNNLKTSPYYKLDTLFWSIEESKDAPI